MTIRNYGPITVHVYSGMKLLKTWIENIEDHFIVTKCQHTWLPDLIIPDFYNAKGFATRLIANKVIER